MSCSPAASASRDPRISARRSCPTATNPGVSTTPCRRVHAPTRPASPSASDARPQSGNTGADAHSGNEDGGGGARPQNRRERATRRCGCACRGGRRDLGELRRPRNELTLCLPDRPALQPRAPRPPPPAPPPADRDGQSTPATLVALSFTGAASWHGAACASAEPCALLLSPCATRPRRSRRSARCGTCARTRWRRTSPRRRASRASTIRRRR